MRRVTGWVEHARAKLKWGVAGGAIVATVVAAACSDRPASVDSNGVINNRPTGTTCNPPSEGCACDTTGATIACGEVVSHQGDYVSCSEGKRTCTGTKWGACVGDHILYRSAGPIGDLRPLGLGGQGACTDNPCDPNCQVITDTGGGLDAGSGLTISPDGGVTLAPGEGGVACAGLQCNVVSCDGGLTTTLTGTAYDPAGNNPIYGAYVYVPVSLPLPPIAKGAQPDPCGGGGKLPPAVAYQLTGPDGKFTLNNVPAGASVPLVIQAGKWRRTVMLNVPACQSTPVAAANSRLPRRQSEGDMPHVAIQTGGCDPMECLLTRIGIDSTEFQDPGKGGAVDFYQATGAALSWGTNPNPSQLLGSTATLAQYDLVMLPCNCGNEYGGAWSAFNSWWGIDNSHHQNLVTYTNNGGRMFASHYGREWIEAASSDSNYNNGGSYPAPFPNVASFQMNGSLGGPDPDVGVVNQGFQRGKDFAAWLKIVGASATLGQVNISPTRYDSTSVVAPTQLWVQFQTTGYPADFTFNTPLGQPPANQFGRVMYTDMHLATNGGGSGWSFPTECGNAPLTPQEDAAEFLLFDLGSCLQQPPPPSPPKFKPATFVRDFTASCPAGKYVQWRTFLWQDMTPSDSNIVFAIRTGDTAQSLLAQVPLYTVSGAPNINPWGGAAVDLALKGAGQVSHPVLEVQMTLNPTSDQLTAPTLFAWQQTFDCVDSL